MKTTLSSIKLTVLVAWFCGAVPAALAQTTAKEQEARLIAVLLSNAETAPKADACRELARIGTSDAVPALAALLANEQLSHMARYGLETIPGPAADAALRAALGTLTGRPLVGVIGSIGVRHDAQAVGPLAGLLQDPAPDVAPAAARALGRIGTAAAAKSLEGALAGATAATRMAHCEGLFRCAETFAANGQQDQAIVIYDSLRNLPQAPHQVLAGAWRGAILTRPTKDGLALLMQALRSADAKLATAALAIAMEMKHPAVSKALADELGKVPAARQIQWCNVLGRRGEAVALPAVLALAASGDKSARVAAIRAACEMGHAAAAAPLIALLKDPDAEIVQAATTGLAGLPGTAVDQAVTRMLDSPDPALKLKMVDLVQQRRIVTALPVLMKLMEDKDDALRAAATRGCSELAGAAELASLLDKIVKNTNAGEVAALEKALLAVCGAAANPQACVPDLAAALAKAGAGAKQALLRTLRVAGGPAALQAVRAATGDVDPEVHTAAIRVLSEWKTGDAAALLLELTRTSDTPVDKILSLRGYLGMAARKELPAPARLEICRQSAPLIQRDDEKLLLLGALANLADPGSLDLAVACLDNPAVTREAVAAVMAIAEKRPKNQQVDTAKAALTKVVQAAADNPAVVKRAGELLQQLATEK